MRWELVRTGKIVAYEILNDSAEIQWLTVEPFGIGFGISPASHCRAIMESTKDEDLTNGIEISLDDQNILLDILGGWVRFKFFENGKLTFDVEC